VCTFDDELVFSSFLGIKMLDEDSIFLLSQSGGTEERFARDNQESINRQWILKSELADVQ
jgi:hypothetical protein